MKIIFFWWYKKEKSQDWIDKKEDSMRYSIEQLAKEHDVYVLSAGNRDDETFVHEKVKYEFFTGYKRVTNRMIDLKPDLIVFNNHAHSSYMRDIPCKKILYYHGGGVVRNPLLEQIDGIVAAHLCDAELLKMTNITDALISVNPHTPDINLFKPMDIEPEFDTCWIGRIVAFKRPFLLYRALKNTDYSMLYIGDFKFALDKDKVESPKMSFAGFVNPKELPEHINKCKIFVTTSDSFEAGSRVILEAMACGKPVIVMDDCITQKEWVEGKDTGLVVKSDLDSIREGIEKLLTDKELYDKCSKGARKFVVENMTYDHMYNEWKRFIDEVMKK